jgi:D-alanine-D-alanine ligase-like ATP-grasp enzyme
MKVGIFFGGNSREREVSFAGGRTVYDNLDKTLFEAIPIFVDSFNNFILLDWHYIYKGSIRDFYPPVSATKKQKHDGVNLLDYWQKVIESIGFILIYFSVVHLALKFIRAINCKPIVYQQTLTSQM